MFDAGGCQARAGHRRNRQQAVGLYQKGSYCEARTKQQQLPNCQEKGKTSQKEERSKEERD